MNEQSVHNLYKNLQGRFGFEGTEEAFVEMLQDEQRRRNLYNNLQKRTGFSGTLRDMMNRDVFAGDKGPAVGILTAVLGNDAGLLGAAALLM